MQYAAVQVIRAARSAGAILYAMNGTLYMWPAHRVPQALRRNLTASYDDVMALLIAVAYDSDPPPRYAI